MELNQEQIDNHLKTLEAAPELSNRAKLVALLRHLVQATLKNETSNLKEYAIGLDVFDRGSAFDPVSDSIVRVQVGRLRKLLDQFYLKNVDEGAIRLAIPKGSYKIEFQSQERAAASENQDLSNNSSYLGNTSDAISVGVLPFKANVDDAELSYFAEGLSDELNIELARISSLSLVPASTMRNYQDSANWDGIRTQLGVRYIIDGSIQRSDKRLRVNIQLIDTITQKQLWTQTYNKITDDIFAVHDEIISNMIKEMRLRIYNAARIALDPSSITEMTAWELFMQSTWMPGAKALSLEDEKNNLAKALRALELNPQYGKAHSVAADKIALLATVDPLSDTAELRAKAAYHMRQAASLGASDVDVLYNIATFHWHNGNTREFSNKLARILELEPNHFIAQFLINSLPYIKDTAPQHIIDEIVAYDADLASDNLTRWLSLTWISLLYFNNENYMQTEHYGRRAMEIYNTPETRNRLCAALVQLGQKEAAVKIVTDALTLWPTTDLHHYADVVIPRIFGDGAVAMRLRKVYGDLANAFDEA